VTEHVGHWSASTSAGPAAGKEIRAGCLVRHSGWQ
jgi:hypothetical protein